MDTTTRTVPTLAQVKRALSADWLERDGRNFVYQRSTGRLDWEKSLPSGSAYSEELLALDGHRDILSEEEILRKAHGMAQTILDTLDIKGRVRLRLNPASDDSRTDGRTVTVSSAVLDDRSVDLTHRLDILLGTAEHEGLHCEFTDFRVHSADKTLQSLVNIVEDERIEHCAGEKYPGLANFLKEFKYYYHDLYRRRHAKGNASLPYSVRLLNAVLALVRYPGALTDSEMEEFGEQLVAVRGALSDFPRSTAESMVTAQKIYEILKDSLKEQPVPETGNGGEEEDEEKDGTEKDREGNGREDGDGTESGKKNGDGQEEKPGEEDGEEDGEDKKGNGGKGEGREEGKDGDGTESAEEKPGRRRSFRELTPEERMKAMDALAKALEEYSKATDSGNQTCDAVRNTPEIDMLCEGEAERGTDRSTLFMRQRSDSRTDRRYADDLDAVRPYIPAMRNILVAQATRNAYALKGMKSGKLDPGKLPQAYIGNPNVHLRRKEIRSSRVAVCVLVDESGSMRGKKIEAARRTAVLLNEALGSLPNVDLSVYGHTADEYGVSAALTVRTYRDRSTRERTAIGAMEARDNNADGYAILETARKVREQTREKVLLFVISDGAPAARIYGGRHDGVQHTREAVRKVTEMGFTPVQIAIDPSCDPASMFDHHVTLTDLSELPRELSAIVRKAVLDNTRRQ